MTMWTCATCGVHNAADKSMCEVCGWSGGLRGKRRRRPPPPPQRQADLRDLWRRTTDGDGAGAAPPAWGETRTGVVPVDLGAARAWIYRQLPVRGYQKRIVETALGSARSSRCRRGSARRSSRRS